MLLGDFEAENRCAGRRSGSETEDGRSSAKDDRVPRPRRGLADPRTPVRSLGQRVGARTVQTRSGASDGYCRAEETVLRGRGRGRKRSSATTRQRERGPWGRGRRALDDMWRRRRESLDGLLPGLQHGGWGHTGAGARPDPRKFCRSVCRKTVTFSKMPLGLASGRHRDGPGTHSMCRRGPCDAGFGVVCRRPFTSVTRVQIPSGTPTKSTIYAPRGFERISRSNCRQALVLNRGPPFLT